MQKSFKIYLALLFALIFILVFVDATKKRPVNWALSYYLDDKDPMGLYVLDQEINGLLSDSVVRYGYTPYEYFKEDSLRGKETYLMINNSLYSDNISICKILDAVRNGSSCFISCHWGMNPLIDSIGVTIQYYDATQYSNIYKDIATEDTLSVHLVSNQWKDGENTLTRKLSYTYFDNFDTKTTTILGYQTMKNDTAFEMINFLRIKYGKGEIFLHRQPSVFTNYSLLYLPDIRAYSEHVLSYLPKNKRVVWFGEYKSEWDGLVNSRFPLRVIFQYPSLRAVWLIFLYGMILFMIFRARRTQRIVPIIQPLNNTTVEFVQTISNLYYQGDNTADIVNKKIIYFLDAIRRKYYLDTRLLDDTFIQKLQLKSGKDIELIKKIVGFVNWFNQKHWAGNEDLTRFNQLLEQFWE